MRRGLLFALLVVAVLLLALGGWAHDHIVSKQPIRRSSIR